MDDLARAAMMRRALVERTGAETCSDARLFRAPGRVNLIGEHTDYNDGFVMPMAINLDAWVAMSPRDDDQLVVYSANVDEVIVHRLGGSRLPPEPKAVHWSQYVVGVAETFTSSGYRVGGANLVIHGTVPIGSGLSSSASLEVSVAMALAARLHGGTPSSLEIAQLCQRAENEHVGARCGIMDQFVSVHGVKNHAVMLDCRTFAHTPVPLSFEAQPLSVVICNTMVRHQLASGEYNRRRRECELAVATIARLHSHVRSLRDVSMELLEACRHELEPVIYRRARHVVTENDRVLKVADALSRRDFASVGLAMAASHESLRDDYAVSCRELDEMVTSAHGVPGVIGARMTGGGFGGCTVNLVASASVPAICAEIRQRYQSKTGVSAEVYVCEAAQGAGEIHDW